MGNRRLNKIECSHVLGMHESERFKITALPCRSGFAQAGLNLWEATRLSFDKPLPGKSAHPTASSRFQKANFVYYDTVSKGRGDG